MNSTGISRTSRHKRSATGAQRAHYRKKRKFELGRQPANTKLGAKRVHTVRTRGGNTKFRALRLDSGNFAWGSEHVTKKARIIAVVSALIHCQGEARDSESGPRCTMLRTTSLSPLIPLSKALYFWSIAIPFRQWYESHVSAPDLSATSSLLNHFR